MIADSNPIEEQLQKAFPDLHFYVHKHYVDDMAHHYVVNYDTDATEDEVEQIKAEMQKMGVKFELERIPF